MIGFVVTPEQAQSVTESVAAAQIAHGSPVFWQPGVYPIYTGEHAGDCFIPCDNETLSTPLIGTPPQTPQDFPEFATIIESIGGLDARIDIPASNITSPQEL